MAQIKTANFLPEAFRTEANRKFLNATLDQLVTQPDLRNVNGFIGRKFAPTFKSTDNYQPEPNVLRQNYQLEPSVVVKNKVTGETEFFSSYMDLLQQLDHYGAFTDNQTRLFSNETYNFDGLFDFDKFVNFGQYYWLENGPDSVKVFGSPAPTTQTFVVTRDPGTGTYKFSTTDGVENPKIQLVNGGTYKFIVNQPGFPFWIQSSPGVNGTKTLITGVSARQVLGVINNGIDVGTVTFNVPLANAQDLYVRMPLAGTATLSTKLSYSDVQGKPLSYIFGLGENGFDGVNTVNQINFSSLIFINSDLDNVKWTANSYTVPVALRRNAWKITLSDDADPIVTLNPLAQAFTISASQKVFVSSGQTRAGATYFLDNDYTLLNLFKPVPDITAPLTTLYYQDGVGSSFAGEIAILAPGYAVIDVDTDIIGAKTYISPSGVVFTNGLKVAFDASVIPSKYQNKTFYVEGVGTGIKLVDVDAMITPEAFAVAGLANKDYITSNRSSLDLNPWARSNRWFHVDVINVTASYNNTIAALDQSLRATRPIIEFDADLQLFNFGRQAKAPIDVIDFTVTDSRNVVELRPAGYQVDGVTLQDGMRIVFASDFDPTVRNKIYVVNIVYVQSLASSVINLVPAADLDVEPFNNLVVLNGTAKGKQYYYNGSAWIQGQQKNAVNQAPLFDVIDDNGTSISEYTDSTFTGTKLFGYSIGTGAVDTVLGFSLKYRNFSQIGDIEFDNNYDIDVFNYVDGNGNAQTGVKVNTAGFLQSNKSLTSRVIKNSWTTASETSKQFQVIGDVYDGNNRYIKIDIVKNVETSVPYFRVYKNSKQITGWEIVDIGVVSYVRITDAALVAGDRIDIVIYNSSQVSQLGYYEVPKNLDFNTQNKSFAKLTLGQLRNHVSTMVANSNQIVGDFPGNSNLRDTYIKAQSGSILQHASPVMYSELFLVDEKANFIGALDHARREYSKIKNKILELSLRTEGLDFTNIPVLLDVLLKNINSVKNKSFSWYYSDMVPYGDIKNTITYTVQNSEIVDYVITNVFDDTKLSNNAVLVYLNNVQLVKDVDYKFDVNRAGVTFIKALTVGDAITINEYSNTDGNYIPETPTKLGLYPKFAPTKYYDTSYVTPTYVIQGHDGSITPAFGDFRDDLLLELEKRIYNNIKVDSTKNKFSIYDYLPGKFRSSDYSIDEFTQLLTNSFLTWVGDNRVDYIANTAFISSNEFTWNYNKFTDVIDNSALLGYWRAIYKHFYDTDRPNTHPWEMLGFSNMPTWWETRYGPAPYTGGNMVLWDDLAQGLVWNNGQSYIDERFVRPGLQNVIPVDANGLLLAPSKFLVKSFNSADAESNFRIGDQGPVESAWRRSSDFPFAMQRALALAKPAFYLGSLLNVSQYYKRLDLNQYIFSQTLQRVTPTDVVFNGLVSANGAVTRTAGYVNWISDYLRYQGIDPTVKLINQLSGASIQLAYKMAGFTDQSLMQVIAEQSSPSSTNTGIVIPNESYSIGLFKSTPTNTVTYSAVVIERTATGYSVSGYDSSTPYFTIIPSLANNNSYSVSVLNDSGVVYQDYQNFKVTIPYGYEFTTRQQVVDFLVSYQRYLKGVGFRFNDVDPDLNVQRDWILSVREFLTWAQQGWGNASVLVVSPVLNAITLFSTSGVVDQIQNQVGQSCVVDTSHNFVKYNQLSVNRVNTSTGNTFTVSSSNSQTLALVKLDVVEYEHVMIFDNVDIFNDIIYVPELGNRQYRLKLIGKKTGSWTGAMNPPGFVFNNTKVDEWQQGKDYLLGALVKFKNTTYTALDNIPAASKFDTALWMQVPNNEIKTGLLPNFTYNAGKFNRFNDVDDPELLGDFKLYSGSSIGFQPRQYLTNFGIDEVTQSKFYQGYIREKGTINAVNAFTAAGFNGVTSDISVYEEWAMRVGEYGALDNNRSVELVLTEGTFNSDPVTFSLLANGDPAVTSIIGVYPNQLYKTEGNYTPAIYKNRSAASNYSNDIQTAGYVNITDVSTTVFNIANLGLLSANLATTGIGSTIWTAIDGTGNWNVYRVSETDLTVTTATAAVDNIGTVTTNKPHNFVYGDIVVIKGFDNRIDGFYKVYNAIDSNNFNVVFYGANADQLRSAKSITGTGALYRLQSQRIQSATDINNIVPLHDWIDGDKLWVDHDAGIGGWAVYNKSTPWQGNVSPLNPSMQLDANSYIGNKGFGTVTTINSAGTFAAAGIPLLNNGNVYAFVSNVTNGNVLTLVSNIGQHSGGSNFGASLDTAGNLLYIGNPGDGAAQQGLVHIHKFNGTASFPWTQTLASPSSSNIGDLYGSAVSASADGTWLFVAAPNAGNVYVYHANANSYYSYANTISVSSSAAAQFGYSIKTTSDASQVAISAPYQAVNGVSSAGAVYVFDRSIERFVASGTVYTTQNAINANTVKVTVNGNVVTTGFTVYSGNVTFTTAPVTGSVIDIETNNFQLLSNLTATTPTSGATFGTVTWISGNDADVYVSSPGYSAPGYYSGLVYRFVNQGASYGTITGTTYSPTVSAGDTIRINGIKVTFTGGNVTTAANNINSANIVGVTAKVEDFGALTISSNIATPYKKLIIGPGTGNALANLGLTVYSSVQTLQHPGVDNVSLFGSQVLSSPDSKTLVVSASGGSTENDTTFDINTTTFDYTASIFIDTIESSGIVYVYGLVGSSLSGAAQDQYVLVQRLQNNNLSAYDQFGYSIAMNNSTMLVGAPGDDNHTQFDPVNGLLVPISGAGTYYTYNNVNSATGWDIVKNQEAAVDIDSIGKMYMYNANTNVILTHLDFIDPAKGKVLGAAQDALDYITAYDPAVYNSVGGIDGAPNLAFSLDYHWGPDQVTKTWWNTGVLRYIDYEQGNLTYRANNWGRTFPGSQVQVCEWVESDMPPSAYPGPGTALHPDNSAYVVETVINPTTKVTNSKYFYWVINKNSIESSSVHKNTITTIQDLIANPHTQDIPYATVVRNDSISLHNIGSFLSGNTTILHADYDTLMNTNIIHSEYQLVQEGNSNSIIPKRIVDKLVDSLSGIDTTGAAVPNAALTPQTRLGLGVAPNQTLFVSRSAALQNWIEFVNNVLIQFPVVKEFNINALYQSAPLPDTASYDISVATYVDLTYIETSRIHAGYAVLVTADETNKGIWTVYTWNGTAWALTNKQSYFTPFYWSLTDWYDSTYDSTVLPKYVVPISADVAKLSLVVGDTVKVLNNGNGEFAVYRVASDGSVDIVGIQNGTLQLSKSIITSAAANEIRIIFNAIKDNIFVDTLAVYFNQMFFFLVNYILTEQPTVDWAFKTSFISILHKLRRLDQPANYSQDNQTYYESYINEVKPYRTSIRDYLIDYQGDDQYSGDSTDFDIPSTYISSYGAYRSPNGADPRDSIWLSTLPQYSQWFKNYSYKIGDVFVSNTGSGYTLPPAVTVVGGGGTGANIQAVINYTTGGIEDFVVVNPGHGYTSQPTIFINGTGTGAFGYAKLVNNYQIDSLLTTEVHTFNNVVVTSGNIVSQANTGAFGTVYTSSTGNVVSLINVNGSFNSSDYIFSDAANLHTNVTSTTSFTQFVNKSYNLIRSMATTITFDRTTYSSNIITWAPNITVTSNSIVSHNGAAYQATSNVYSTTILTTNGNIVANIGDYITQSNSTANARVISVSANAQVITVANLTSNYTRRQGNLLVNNVDSNVVPIVVNNLFDYTKYTPLDNSYFVNAADRITAFYQPTVSMPSKDLAQLMSGIEYPGVTVTGVGFADETSVFNSNIIYSSATEHAIYSSNVTIPSLLVTITSSAVVYTGNVITQDVSGATGIVYATSTDNNITLIDVVGTFDTTHYISSNSSNLGVKVTTSSAFNQDTRQNKVDFTALGYSAGQPIVLIDTDTSTQNELIITEVDTWRLVVSGTVPTTTIGSNLALKYYDYNNPTYLDSIISSNYNTPDSNVRISVDGGAYYDTFSSHAPEELVPGVTYDNLNMVVTTRLQNNTVSTSYRVVHNMGANAASTNTAIWPKYYGVSNSRNTVLTANLNITDGNIHVANASALTPPNVITLTPGTVFINGEKITFWGVDAVNNVLTQIRRAVDGTGAPLVHVAGLAVQDVNSNELIPGGNIVHTSTWLNAPVGAPQVFTDNFGNTMTDNFGNVITSAGASLNAVTDGAGLEGSLTDQALFIKGLI
jgi:FG-GAP repeat